MAIITVGCPTLPFVEFLEEWTMENLEEVGPSTIPDATKVFLNGVWVGVHRDPDMLVNTLRELRRCVDVNAEVSIVRDVAEKELRLYTDAGRISRPLFIVDAETQKLKLTKDHIAKLNDKDDVSIVQLKPLHTTIFFFTNLTSFLAWTFCGFAL
jgi:DNA-directed RNA polymerase II subunit RPB2